MTAIELQKQLEKRMEECFKHLKLLKPKTKNNQEDEKVKLNIFMQDLPEKPSSDVSLYPYLVIKLVEGEITGSDSPFETPVLFIVGVWDPDNKYRGHESAMTVINKAIEDLIRNPIIGERFQLKFPLKWKKPDEDLFPFHFAGIEARFEVPKPVRETEDIERFI